MRRNNSTRKPFIWPNQIQSLSIRNVSLCRRSDALICPVSQLRFVSSHSSRLPSVTQSRYGSQFTFWSDMLYYGTIQLNLKKLERLNLRSHFRNFFSLFVLRWCSDNKIAAHGTTKIILRSTNSADVFSHQKNRVFFRMRHRKWIYW